MTQDLTYPDKLVGGVPFLLSAFSKGKLPSSLPHGPTAAQALLEEEPGVEWETVVPMRRVSSIFGFEYLIGSKSPTVDLIRTVPYPWVSCSM